MLWQHIMYLCALFLVQGGMWTAYEYLIIINVVAAYLTRESHSAAVFPKCGSCVD
jgi:hypothetical protein